MTDEPCITRILSTTTTGRRDLFRAPVRERDGKCVISGLVNTGAYRDVGGVLKPRTSSHSPAKNIGCRTNFLGGYG
ncbi:hypothetical protein V1508DRAFT_423511 [Lipomyces doorenjongii]|uniref:uncharacterized protein n=1 Tax=Lipomyces doorenjongii TaxID=383834 RepID=UPI0034CE5027